MGFKPQCSAVATPLKTPSKAAMVLLLYFKSVLGGFEKTKSFLVAQKHLGSQKRLGSFKNLNESWYFYYSWWYGFGC